MTGERKVNIKYVMLNMAPTQACLPFLFRKQRVQQGGGRGSPGHFIKQFYISQKTEGGRENHEVISEKDYLNGGSRI